MPRNPKDLDRSAEKFREFHSRDPEFYTPFDKSLKIPSKVCKCGDAKWIAYRSDKWTGKFENYIHDHNVGVGVYTPENLDINKTAVPKNIKSVKTLVRLGECLGFCYVDDNGEEILAETDKPYPELFCTPDGDCLIVIEDKKDLVVLLWGGSLDVLDRGIVG